MTPNPFEERVICLPAAWVNETFGEGFMPTPLDENLLEIMKRESVVLPRPEAENNPEFKHLVSYSIISSLGGISSPDRKKIFTYSRDKSGGEARLHAALSIGVGGHLIPEEGIEDFRLGEFMCEIQREIDEEIIIHTMTYGHNIIGFVNDNSNPVGRVHLGIVSELELWFPRAFPRESCLADAKFWGREKFAPNLGRFESWSRILLESHLIHILNYQDYT